MQTTGIVVELNQRKNDELSQIKNLFLSGVNQSWALYKSSLYLKSNRKYKYRDKLK